MNHPQLQAQLRRLGRRVRGVGGASGLGWGLVAMGVIALAGAWTDLVLELSPALRVGALATALLAGLALAIARARRAWRRAVPAALARRLDPIAGAQGQIVAGVDLFQDMRVFTPPGAGLAGIAVERAAELASDVPGPRVAPVQPALISALAAGVLAASVALIALALPRLALALWLRFSDPLGDHPPYSAVVFQLEPGDIKVIYGQGVEIRATAEGAPVDRLELVLEPAGSAPERLAMFPEGSGRWRAAVANVTSSGRYYVHADRARSPRHRIEVITVPRLTGVRFRVTPPAYTRRPVYEGPLPSEGLAGLPGARVEVWASSNRPLAAGTLQVATAQATVAHDLVPATQAAQEVYGSFEIKADAKLEIRVRDVAGQDSQESFSAAAVLLRDERPFIRITEPREVSFATPDVLLPVILAAEDDYGIARVQLHRTLNGSRALPIDLTLGGQAPTRWNDQTYLPLSEYGLRAGDEIKLFARVEDNDPAGSKGSESAIVTVRIIPRDVYERLLRAREGMEVLEAKYREAERRLESLTEEVARLQAELDKLPPDSPLAREQEQKINELARRLREETAAIRESARHPLPYDIDQKLSRELEALAQSLDRLAEASEQLASQSGLKNGAAAKALADLRERLAGGRKQFENDALAPIEHLARIYPLLEDQARFVQLDLRQRDLAGRLASLKGHDGEDDPARKARMRDLEAEQSQIRTDLGQLLDDIEEHARRLPDDPRLAELQKTAESFAAAVRVSGASEAMADAESGLAAFSGTRSSGSAKNAADILERFVATCSGGGELAQQSRGGLKFQPALAAGLGNSIEQMLADAGFSSPGQLAGAGAGMGIGAGNGYSARQSNLHNVGLYGNRPTLTASARQGSGRSAAGAGRGRSSGSPAARHSPETFAAPGTLSAAGGAQTPIPASYRRRVADYFQRIADEVGDR
ncbi:MAG: hypothetical protein ACHRXM_12880 [Isosphaerales bacterium]